MGSPEREENFLGFLFGNLDEDNQVEADYLDHDALNHLSGLAKLQGAGLEELQAEVAQKGSKPSVEETAAEPEERAADALDFADEDELIEDAQPAPSMPSAVGAALAFGAGGDAEDEDYDMDEADEEPAVAQAVQTGSPPSVQPTPPTAIGGVPLPPPRPESTAEQLARAKEQGLDIPLLSNVLPGGENVIAFTDLRPTMVDEEPPPKPREQAQHPRVQAPMAPPPVPVTDDEAILSAAPQALAARGLHPGPPPEPEEAQLEDAGERAQQAQQAGPRREAIDVATPSTTDAGPSSSAPATAVASRVQRPGQLAQTGDVAAYRGPGRGGAAPRGGPAFATLPDCVFNPIISQERWEERAELLWRSVPGSGGEAQVEEVTEQAEAQSVVDKIARAEAGLEQRRKEEEDRPPSPQLPAWSAEAQVSGTSANAADTSFNADPIDSSIVEWSVPAPLLRQSLAGVQGAAAPTLLALNDIDIAERLPAWETNVSLVGGHAAAQRLRSQPVVLDLNDPSLILEMTRKEAPALQPLLAHASATVLPPLPKVQFSAKGQDITNEAALELMRLNISKDKTYFAQPKRRNASRLSRSIHHSKFAVRLATIPLQPTHEQLAQWHRPRGLWWPLRPVKAPVARHGVSVALCTLTHHVDRKFLDVSSSEVQLSQLWDEVWMKRKLLRQDVEEVKDLVKPLFVVPGKPAQIVNGDVALIHSGAIKKDTARLGIVVAYRDAVLMPTAKAENVPDEANAALLRPPLAFGRKEELAASAPGKVLLLEYMEEAPALLNRPGMGARLTTYYRQSNAADAGHWRMRDAAISGGRLWRVGAVVPLGSEDESPFLGELKPGTGQLSVETGLFTAPAHSYNSLPSDFLLTRSSAGVMRVREITGAITSGQQLPLHRIPPPGARDLKDLLERRMYVYVFQTLRTDQSNLDKNPGNQAVAVVSLKEMHRLFPSRPLNMIRLYLKNECGLEYMGKRHGSDDELFGLKPGARLPSEAEIKKKLSPEEACVAEAALAAELRLRARGINENQNFGFVAPEKLRLAAEMLPDDPEIQLAAKAVEHALQTAPWTLTDAFVTCFREGRATMRLLGPGDPTGRGAGYSFIRDIRHKAVGDDQGRAAAKQRAGKVQGTDADLRRMTTEQAKQKLLSFGLDEAEVEPLGRWVRIDLVRQLANASAADGSVAGVAKYVRHQKTTLLELQKRYRERAQEVFDRQVAVLSDAAGEDLGAQGELEAELEAELEEETGKKTTDKKGREASPSPEEEARQLEEMRAAGLLGDGAGPSTAAAPQQDLAALSAGIEGPLIPGQTRRIRREILRDLGVVDGKKQYEKVKEIIYGGREKPYLLASLYQSPDGTMTGPWGFGKREVTFLSGARGGGKLTYAAARGKGMTRGRRGGRGGRGGRGSRGGRVASGAVRKPRGGKRGRRPKDFEDEELHDDDFDDGYHAPTYTGGERASRRVRVQKKIDEDHVEYIEGVSEEEEEVAISEDDVDVFEALGDRANGMEEDDIRAFEAELKRKAKAEKAAAAAANPKPKRQPPEGGARPKPKAKPKAKPQEPKVPKAPAPQPLDFREQFIKGDEMDDIFGSESPSEADNEGDEYVPEEMDSDDAQNQRRSKRRKTGPAASLPRQLAPGEVPEFTLDLANLNAAPIGWNLGQPAAGAAPGGVLSEREARRQGREQQRVVAQYAPQPSIPKNRPKRATQAKRTTYDFDEPEVADDSGDDSFGDYEYEDEEEFEERKPRKSTKAPAKKTMTAPSRGGGNVALNKIFLTVLKELKAAGDSIRKQNRSAWTYWHMFAKRVTGVSDYKKYVPAAKEMWLEKVQEQAKKNAYSNVEAFLADIRQIRDNAHAYNGPGGGKSRGGDIPDFVDGLPGFVENLLATKQIEIEAALAAPAVDWAPPAAPSRAATVLHIPEFSMDDFAPSASVQQVHSAQQEASVAQQPSAQTVPQMKVKLKPL